VQQRLVKTGGRLVKHVRYFWLLLAEGHLNRRRFGVLLRSIAMLPVPQDSRSAAAEKSAQEEVNHSGTQNRNPY
jgi:hypothetical protein